MRRSTRAWPALLILSAVLGGMMFLKQGPAAPAAPRAASPFRTADEARAFVAARLLAAERFDPAADVYALSYWRTFTDAEGETHPRFLVAGPERELELAEGFAAHGYHREALVHLENLVTYHPQSPQARVASKRLEGCRRNTLFGLVAPPGWIAEKSGDLLVPAAPGGGGVGRMETADLERLLAQLHRPYLVPAPPGLPDVVVGRVDDNAQCRYEEPVVPPSFDARDYHSLPPGCRSLFAAEREAKVDLLRGHLRDLPDGSPLHPKVVEAFLYLGCFDEAREWAQVRDLSVPETPLHGDLRAVAADPAHPLALDALWLLKLQEKPKFILATKSSVTTTDALALEVELDRADRISFSFARIEGPLPAREAELKEWLATAPAKPAHETTLEAAAGKQALALPIPAPGSYRVTARARGLSCTFTAVRADATVEILSFPGETILYAGRPGFSVSASGTPLGVTDADGLLAVGSRLRLGTCAEHRECCSTCDSCAHHHGSESEALLPRIFVSGNGQFFRAGVKVDSSEVVKAGAVPPRPLLFVSTDRPVYKAGDTMRFQGILRLPKAPLQRNDEARLLSGPGQEVTVDLRSGEASLFRRTYVTGDPGTFHGEFTLPLTAFRTEYKISVTHNGGSVTHPFEVMDYRKDDYSVILTSAKGGVRVEAGYTWGAPVPDARVVVTVDDRPVEPKDGFVPAKDGERVKVVLKRGADELAVKGLVHREKPSFAPAVAGASEGKPVTAAVAPPSAPSAVAGATEDRPAFRVRTSKAVYRKGEEIEVELEGPWEEATATVLLADQQLYDHARVSISKGRGKARFPARAIHDPGVTVHALCNGQKARAEVLVRTQEMRVAIEAPAKGRPGEEVEVTVKAEPRATFSLSAVDEAIYMLREDDAPPIYAHFYAPRPSALAHGRFEAFEFDGETFTRDPAPEDPKFKDALWHARGDSLDFVSDKPFKGKGTYDVIGGGAGGGGRFGSRLGGRRNLVARGGGSAETEDAVLKELKALAALQQPDGSWLSTFATEAGTMDEQGVTGLVLLGYLGAGYSHLSKDTYGGLCFGDVVRNGLRWILSRQNAAGRIGPGTNDATLNHALSALALTESYGLTGSNLFQAPAQRAIDFLVARQGGDGGWHRGDPAKTGEILATAWAAMCLKSAEISGLTFPRSGYDGARAFLDRVTGENGLCGKPPTRATVASAVMSRIFIDKNKGDPRLSLGCDWLLTQRPDWSQEDMMGWYFASLALFQFDGPSGPKWQRWNEAMKNTLVRSQGRDGLWTVRGESIYNTAMGGLQLEVYYRYSNVFGSRGGSGGDSRETPDLEDPLAPATHVRVYFPDTALWVPDLLTDERGEARASFRLPEQITSTRLTARGVSKPGGAGEAVARIATEQPFFVKIHAPEFAVLGDELVVRAEVFNYTGAELEAHVALEGAPGTARVRVPADRPASASWRVQALDPAGLRLAASARTATHADAMERTLPVRRPGRETEATIRGRTETGQAFRFEAPAGARELVVKVLPRAGNLTQVLEALRYLNSYPYG